MKKRNSKLTRRRAVATAAGSAAVMALGCSQSGTNADNGKPADQEPSNALAGSKGSGGEATGSESSKTENGSEGENMQVQYVEIVTSEAEAACKLYSEIHGVTFGEPEAALGGARLAEMAGGSKFAVRAPMHAGEKPVTRAYVLVEDIEAAVEKAKAAGAQIAVPPMPLPGHGMCAIYMQGGIEAGLWQRESKE